MCDGITQPGMMGLAAQRISEVDEHYRHSPIGTGPAANDRTCCVRTDTSVSAASPLSRGALRGYLARIPKPKAALALLAA